MKALKSPLAKQLLADPDARKELRIFLMNKTTAASALSQPEKAPPPMEQYISFSTNGSTVRVTPKVVLRAA